MDKSGLRDLEHTVLVIEGDANATRVIRASLAEWEGGPLHVQWAETLAQGVKRLLQVA